MSAYIVEKSHILFIVSAAMSRRLNPGHGSGPHWNTNGYEAESWAHGKLSCGDYEEAARIANILWQENLKSIQARYRGDDGGGIETITLRDIAAYDMPEIDPVHVFKSIDCYCYQACEHDGWGKSEARAFCEGVRSLCWHALPGYDEARWGAPEKRTHKPKPELVTA